MRSLCATKAMPAKPSKRTPTMQDSITIATFSAVLPLPLLLPLLPLSSGRASELLSQALRLLWLARLLADPSPSHTDGLKPVHW